MECRRSEQRLPYFDLGSGSRLDLLMDFRHSRALLRLRRDEPASVVQLPVREEYGGNRPADCGEGELIVGVRMAAGGCVAESTGMSKRRYYPTTKYLKFCPHSGVYRGAES